jgi:glyoxylase-like metal-dependent hydrolase (beta-lactamase superfamily II)
VTPSGFPPPVVANAPVEIGEAVYLIPDGGAPLVPNVGIVVGSRATLVIESGMGPRSGVAIRSHAEQLGHDRPLYLTSSHFHGEHSYGAQVFERGATIIYNAGQRDEQRRKGPKYLEMFKTIDDAIATEIEHVRLIEPDIVYDSQAFLNLGGLTAELRAQPPAHTPADQVVFVPEQRILFTGDLVETRCFAMFPWLPSVDVDVDGDSWIDVLHGLERLNPAIVVPGHGEIGGAAIITAAREYLETLKSETRRVISHGATENEAVDELTQSLQAQYPEWENPEWIEGGVRCFYATFSRNR